jgi:anti-sigma B factor antagonist
MSFTPEKHGGFVVVGIGTDLIAANRGELKETVIYALASGARRFRLDFRATNSIDSSGLGALVSLNKKVREAGGEVRVANMNAELRTLFGDTKLDLMFLFEDDDDEDGGAGAGIVAWVRPKPRGGGQSS